MSWLQEKYIKLCNLPLLIKNGNNYNFRCTICNDSAKKKLKKRGYLLFKDNSYIYYCHNCNVGKEGNGISFEKYMKVYQSNLYIDYIKEKLFDKNKKTENNEIEIKHSTKHKEFISNLEQLEGLNKVIDIETQNIIIKFLENRYLPSSFVKGLYYTYDFQEYVNKYIGKKFENPIKETRIVIPCYNKDKKLIAIQGRNLTGGDNKYIIINIIENEIKLWNIENINEKKDVYIFEGTFDSCFFKNAISTFGASFNIDSIKTLVKNRVFVFDNDFRYNRNIKERLINIINHGERISILPKKIKEKDVNKMIQNGYTVKEVLKLIKDNTYKGIEAMLKVKL